MAQVGNVPEINEVKTKLSMLKDQNLVKEWEVPYENILTRLTAAIFFVSVDDDSKLDKVWGELNSFPRMHYRPNEEKTLSQLEWRVEFNKDFEL